MAVTEERILTTTTIAPAGAGPDAAPQKASKKKLLVVLPLVLAVVGGAVWFFLLRGGEAKAEQAPEKGNVLVVESVNINLADGHYLKLGFALQLSKGVKEDPDPSQALDLAIDQLSGKSMVKLSNGADRDKAWATLTSSIEKAYEEGAVIDVYKREFVMQ